MDIEKITNLDELKALGYFESIRSVFFTKLLLLINHTDGKKLIINIPEDVKAILNDHLDFPQYLKALKKGNKELLLNFQEDIVTTLLINSWVVFELIIKSLSKKNYALSEEDISVNYYKNIFGLTQLEKKNLDLFYYIRNAFVHYNGAYYSYKEIDHVYNGHRFFSKSREGSKIIIPDTDFAFKMHLDIEKYAYKAWDNYHKKQN
ncbi:hypothetical protein FRZ67_05360 [Panacibacter ginsenosidivorans]|uniref:Cthe-2314-like HEPN domain-containing protein n=1 Tax=Panacibacter ginsenosidivorans TaxID=1813871 RepID=A0A5B8V8U0_9BACT|nr:hypothetical protein [Panacibacter ginsenosidivorans]QEC66758.1 hypothetical protein FRZ67_05360 [Panacibacter ginsenosidivorans]